MTGLLQRFVNVERDEVAPILLSAFAGTGFRRF